METTVPFFSGRNYHSYRRPQTTGPFFFSGCNYVKIGFGGNVTTGKKTTYSRLAGYVFQRVQITNGKITTGKKNVLSSARQLETGKITSGNKKGTVVSSRWLEGKTQYTTHIIDTTTNKMSHATLPSSGFAPSLSMGGAVAPPNHGAAAPQPHAQAATCRGCACCRWFACLGRQNKRQRIIERGGVPWL
jgi:hypothetical protein